MKKFILFAFVGITFFSPMVNSKSCDKSGCDLKYRSCLSLIKNDAGGISSAVILAYAPPQSLDRFSDLLKTEPLAGQIAIEKSPVTWRTKQEDKAVIFQAEKDAVRGEVSVPYDAWKTHCRNLYNKCVKDTCP